jgi:tetratricopeptide (TPR) repeat protein
MTDHLISFNDARSDLLACSAFLAESIKSSDGRSEALMAVVPQYLAKGDVDLAAELANTAGDPFTRDRLLILVAEKCAELNDDEYALQLAYAIEDYGLQSQARERIALRKASQGDFEKARVIADEIDHPDSVIAGIAIKQDADGDMDGALKTIGEIGFPGAAVYALTSMAVARLEAGEQDNSVGLLENASAAADDIEHNEEKIRALSDIGNLFIEAKRNDRAIETFDKARANAETLDNIHRDAFLAAISLGFLRAGSMDLADRTLDLVADKTQMATALLGFARELWRRDEKNEALEALEESYAILKSQRESETRDSKAKFALFTSIAAQFAGFDKGERAIGIAQEIVDENEQMSALGQIAQVLTIQKKEDLAKQAIRAIQEDASRVFALIGVSDGANENGEKETAKSFLEEAAVLTETVPQLASRTSAYIGIAKRFKNFGDMTRMREISLLNLETIATIRDESSRAAALANLAELYDEAKFELGGREKEILVEMVRKAAI